MWDVDAGLSGRRLQRRPAQLSFVRFARRIAWALIALLALSTAPGCGSGDSGNAAGKSPNADQAQSAAANTRIGGRLKKFSVQFNLYQMEHEGAPATFDAIQAAADPSDREAVFSDDRVTPPVPFTFLPPGDRADDADLLAHTDPAGPLPILGVKQNGQVVTFDSVDDFDKHMQWQDSHPAPNGPGDSQAPDDRDPADTPPARDPTFADDRPLPGEQ